MGRIFKPHFEFLISDQIKSDLDEVCRDALINFVSVQKDAQYTLED